MNEEVKVEWLTALRSGEYKQGHHLLENDRGELCCLGVLCQIAVKHGIVTRDETPTVGAFTYRSVKDVDDHSAVVLPTAVMRWAGLNANNPGITYKPGEKPLVFDYTDPDDGRETQIELNSLTQVNDSVRWTFSQIANLIEEKF